MDPSNFCTGQTFVLVQCLSQSDICISRLYQSKVCTSTTFVSPTFVLSDLCNIRRLWVWHLCWYPNSIQSSLKSHPLWVTLYIVYNLIIFRKFKKHKNRSLVKETECQHEIFDPIGPVKALQNLCWNCKVW